MALQQAQLRGGGIFLDGVYRSSEGVPVSHEVRGPTPAELERCLSRIIQHILRLPTRTGYLIEEQGMRYWHHAYRDVAAGVHAVSGRTGPACQAASDSLPWHARAPRQVLATSIVHL